MSVFSACGIYSSYVGVVDVVVDVDVVDVAVIILVGYMVIFPASYSEVESRPREVAADKNKTEEDRKVRSLQLQWD